MNNINISLEEEINNSEFNSEIKKEALNILEEVMNGSSDDKIKDNLQNDIYKYVISSKNKEGEEKWF